MESSWSVGVAPAGAGVLLNYSAGGPEDHPWPGMIVFARCASKLIKKMRAKMSASHRPDRPAGGHSRPMEVKDG